MSFAWDPPALALVAVGVAALVGWLALSPPRREAPVAAGLQVAAALALGLALLNVGWRPADGDGRPTLVVLMDRSASMEIGAPDGQTRRAAADAWLEGDRFARWSAGWRVEVDSFGGATTDPATAIEAAAATLPQAILVVGDGRATGGRVASAPGVPLFVHAPGPLALADAAVLELAIAEDETGAAAEVELAAVGGGPTRERALVTRVDGRVVARTRAPALAAGERRVVRVALPDPGPGERVVEARLEEPADPVAGNDARAVGWRADDAGRTLVAGLDPGWELGALRRALETGSEPVDVVWGGREGALREADGGAATSWEALDPARYQTLWLMGDPALLGTGGRRWVVRFLGAGGRGLYWSAGPAGGEVDGVRAPPAGGEAGAVPVVTDAGRRWLEGLSGEAVRAPDGSRAWPPLEALPGAAVELPAGARVLVRAGATPAAWSIERDGNRALVALGTGWYRFPLAGGDAGRAFWGAWVEAARRWLGAASPAARPLVGLPPGGRVAAGEARGVSLAQGVGPATWRVIPAGGGDPVATGVATGDSIELGPLPAGAWRLEVTAAGRSESHALAVESWTPDLARTEADTVSLPAAARASGGGEAGPGGAPLPTPAGTEDRPAGPVVGLGLVPWAFLAGALLVLGHWAVTARSR